MKTDESRPKENPPTKSPSSEIVSFFTSVQTTVVLLFLLAAASIIGTVVPQQESIEELAGRVSPFVLKLIVILDLNTMFSSWWYLLLLALMAANLMGCLFQRVPGLLEDWRNPSGRKSFGFTHVEPVPPAEAVGIVQEKLRPIMGAPEQEDKDSEPGSVKLTFVRHRLFLLGFPLIHTAIVVILAGGLMGLMYGYKGQITIREGETKRTFVIPADRSVRPLPFELALDNFTLLRYPNGAPKEYRSDVRIIRNGAILMKESIRVNHPITIDGLSLYQANYRSLGVEGAILELTGVDGEPQTVTVKSGGSAKVRGTDYSVRLLQGLSSGSLGQGVEVEISGPDGKTRVAQLFQGAPKPVALNGVGLKFKDFDILYSSGLQVGYDPGTPVVWIGCTLLIIGFVFALFLNLRALTVVVSPASGGSRIVVGGRSRRLRRDFRETVEQALTGTGASEES